MKRLQMAGNKPIALLGGGTGMIRGSVGQKRPAPDDDRWRQSSTTADCFKQQMSRFIDFQKAKAMMVNNAEWLMGPQLCGGCAR